MQQIEEAMYYWIFKYFLYVIYCSVYNLIINIATEIFNYLYIKEFMNYYYIIIIYYLFTILIYCFQRAVDLNSFIPCKFDIIEKRSIVK